MPRANRQGRCPYCEASEGFLLVEQNRPDREIMQCSVTGCGKYFVRHVNKSTYPLIDPNDRGSSPAKRTPE